mmetsp:Transcript_115532/g.331614  ORF Transcript_115532/g.331614 Transcript_115532/m.331614 type:complete len:263 (-) Transcript_115532:137-925(-)
MQIPDWLQSAGARERPWWLKTNAEAGRQRGGRWELPYSPRKDVAATATVPSSGSVSSESLHRQRTSVPRDASMPASCPPLSPASHMRRMQNSVQRPLQVTACDEYHRYMYFPRCALKAPPGQLVREETARGPEAKAGLGRRRKVVGTLDSDCIKAGKDVERGWKLDAIRRAKSEPGFGHRPHAVNPSLLSSGVSSCMTGGTHISLKHALPKSMHRAEARQVGLYEDFFENWRGNYRSPEHGLAQSDVTQFAGEMLLQKASLR